LATRRPNVGKSRLAQLRFLRRAQGDSFSPDPWHPPANTIDTTIEREGKTMRNCLDTPAFRRRRSVSYGPEYFGITAASRRWKRKRCLCCWCIARPRRRHRAGIQRACRAHREDGPRLACGGQPSGRQFEKDSHTTAAMEKEMRAKLFSSIGRRWLSPPPSAASGLESIFAWPCWRWSQHASGHHLGVW